jgi:hypothetical protein
VPDIADEYPVAFGVNCENAHMGEALVRHRGGVDDGLGRGPMRETETRDPRDGAIYSMGRFHDWQAPQALTRLPRGRSLVPQRLSTTAGCGPTHEQNRALGLHLWRLPIHRLSGLKLR